MKVIRKQVQNIQAFKIGSFDRQPSWLKQAIDKKNIVIKPDNKAQYCWRICWNNTWKHFYEGDYVVKLPEGPIIGVREQKFKLLYEEKKPPVFVEDFTKGSKKDIFSIPWVKKAIKEKRIEGSGRLLIIRNYRNMGYDKMFLTDSQDNCKITYEDIYGDENE